MSLASIVQVATTGTSSTLAQLGVTVPGWVRIIKIVNVTGSLYWSWKSPASYNSVPIPAGGINVLINFDDLSAIQFFGPGASMTLSFIG